MAPYTDLSIPTGVGDMGRVVGTLESTLEGPIEDFDPKCYKSEVIREKVLFFSD